MFVSYLEAEPRRPAEGREKSNSKKYSYPGSLVYVMGIQSRVLLSYSAINPVTPGLGKPKTVIVRLSAIYNIKKPVLCTQEKSTHKRWW